MKKQSVGLLLISLLFVSLSAVAGDWKGDSEIRPAADQQEVDSKPLLLFFLNPNGRPCQMQSGILKQNLAEIEKHVRIQGISTTVPSHRQFFYQFGVRRLPSLILIENSGTVLHRFSPGIHQGAEILAVIGKPGKP